MASAASSARRPSANAQLMQIAMRDEALQITRQTFLPVLDPVEAPRQPRQGGLHNHRPAERRRCAGA
ncbi:hypothetical protein XAP412_1100014 [Xanthomonas phaseoli pv. phaseoli]|uniref:Uncharacterized protein n=1 Tax=Xanthomonas campestris pv. phaseoli TaxID=317013 RepID=A0AB38DUQ0_XANCH|nr:hypothetical protein XAP412_1100014 [Xanthomonas phaseoli pv. phaseoli]SON76258.1 hypothetical protein XAP6984_1150014 [Xanthomonas phaseoli pv. phaseoli]SON79803.1 hypothetical protein XAP7430_1120014 [Xanthomonas phaseoli pv. phaseoli]